MRLDRLAPEGSVESRRGVRERTPSDSNTQCCGWVTLMTPHAEPRDGSLEDVIIEQRRARGGLGTQKRASVGTRPGID